MNPDYNIYEEIDLYLKGKMEAAQLDAFQKKLSADPGLQKMVEVQRIANRVIITKQLAGLKEKMSLDLKNDPSPGMSLKNIILFSSLLALISASIFFFLNKKEEKNKIVENKIFEKEIVSADKKEINEEKEISSAEKRKKSKTSLPDTTEKQTEIISYDKEVKEDLSDEAKDIKEDNSHARDLENVNDSKPKAVDCNQVSITIPIDATPTCNSKEEGIIAIRVENIKGGSAPYLFSFDNGKTYSKKNIFRNLKADSYSIFVKESGGCVKEVSAEVKEKLCRELINDVFNPDNANWKIPVEDNKEATIKIFSKSGILVYSKVIPEGVTEEWDGRNNQGSVLDQGLYAFVITYKDGSEQHGYISIMY